jgi:hypothetical protein
MSTGRASVVDAAVRPWVVVGWAFVALYLAEAKRVGLLASDVPVH